MKLTANEAAVRLGVTDRTVRNYISLGKMPAEKQTVGLDWKYMIELDDVIDFARKHSIQLRDPESESQ